MPMIKNLCAEIYAEKNIRANLIELNQMIKDDAYLDRFLDEYYENEIYFINLLEHSDAKVRKNAVKLLGRVGDPTLLDILFEHYQAEETQFLKSDYLAAIAGFDYKKYLPEFKERWKLLENQERTKHSAEEIKQLQKLVWKAEPPERHTFTGDHLENKLLLIVSGGQEAEVLKEARSIPDTEGKTMKGGCLITTGQLAKVREIRTYQALLFDFYPASIPALDGETIGKTILDAGLTEYICRRHKEEHSFLFRVDVRGQKDIVKKNQLAKELSTYLQENSRGMLINESSFYEVEIRVIVGGQSSRVFLRLTCMPDERFRYRKYATATSMHPSKAAMIVHCAKPYLRPAANILDPFCGTGMLLIERAFGGPYKSLYGLDISGPAVQAAWENGSRAGVNLHLIQRNFNDFKHEYKFDEIITDMPRGNTKNAGVHADYIYHLLFSRSLGLLAPEGIMVIYSEDEAVMEKKLTENLWLRRLEKISMSRDKSSWLYILQNKDK